jgi:tyrosinase
MRKSIPGLSRRLFLETTVAATVVTALPLGSAFAQSKATWRRWNVTNRQGHEMLKVLAAAIKELHGRKVDDPFNMYRYAMTHTMDCPHGNWWFLPWHRGYMGYFEQICRQVTGVKDFAIPYWDWSAQQQVPDSMYLDWLTPETAGFIPRFADFYKTFAFQLDQMYRSFSPEQNVQLGRRNYGTSAAMWKDIEKPPNGPMFFDIERARGLKRSNPKLDEFTSLSASKTQVLLSLSPSDFVTFGSPIAKHHSDMAGFGPLEMFPHNKIHNCVGGIVYNIAGQKVKDNGGFMQANLSPTDPIFFLHHSNMDRLWDVWTRKQIAYGKPTTPLNSDTSKDKDIWEAEPFLFFVDASEKIVPHTAKEFVDIGQFDYDYEQGTGEEVVPTKSATVAANTASGSTPGRVTASALGGKAPASANFALNSDTPSEAPLFAKVVIDIPPGGFSSTYKILLNAPANTQNIGPGNPHFVEMISFFGHDMMSGQISVVVPLRGQQAAGARALLASGKEQTLSVVQESGTKAGNGRKLKSNGMAMSGGNEIGNGAKLVSVDILSQ